MCRHVIINKICKFKSTHQDPSDYLSKKKKKKYFQALIIVNTAE